MCIQAPRCPCHLVPTIVSHQHAVFPAYFPCTHVGCPRPSDSTANDPETQWFKPNSICFAQKPAVCVGLNRVRSVSAGPRGGRGRTLEGPLSHVLLVVGDCRLEHLPVTSPRGLGPWQHGARVPWARVPRKKTGGVHCRLDGASEVSQGTPAAFYAVMMSQRPAQGQGQDSTVDEARQGFWALT